MAGSFAQLDGHILTIMWSERNVGAMDDSNTDVIQGTLDMLILKTLSLEPMHGFGIARRVNKSHAACSRSIQDRC